MLKPASSCLLALLSACATTNDPPGFGADDVRHVWQTRWNPIAHGIAAGSEPTAVRTMTCRKKGKTEFARIKEFRRAHWCSFVLDYRLPDGGVGSLNIDRWLVGETERRIMRAPRSAVSG